ncbi:mannitol dehydrogenase family protein [Labrenzia sp. 011]|uniref:mannitol dehydrogenase family protein n=1 Tax=Labrenzia sp. 011 TaxID=2171494 RepID=UPI000D51F11E|nr:mannitol dehydrogenase family protein [Labrenzia sp. 011]PVB60106.1 D-mannonate oxidoreductase [Labrenzia sp. 011]
MPTTPIIQFGTSRFLQAHVDLFISEAIAEGQDVGPIAVVQTSGDPSRAQRLKALAKPDGYEVRIKGIENGSLVETSRTVTSIRRALSLPDDLDEVSRIVAEEAGIILSNTADAGFQSRAADESTEFSIDMSYPAKLAWFLFQRFSRGARPVQVMPAELIPENGKVLKELVLAIAALYPPEFAAWLDAHVTWVNSLVDRIVSEPLEPAGAVAEPYALWAIEDQRGLILPCRHPSVQVVGDLEQIETLKLYILNLGHTYLVARWLAAGRTSLQFVRELMDSPDFGPDLVDLYRKEVIPGFAAHGRKQEAERYAVTTIDRFKNPFLDHRLADIAQNHREKTDRRIASFLSWARKADPALEMPRLDAAVQATRAADA